MSRFANDLNVSVSFNKESEESFFKLLTPFSFISDLLLEQGKVWTIEVPAEFTTNFANVPSVPILWNIAGGIGNKAATIHDFLYTYHIYDRKTSDRVFKEALKVEGVSRVKRNLMYAAVRMFGQKYWDEL